jgi:hypothetical protein
MIGERPATVRSSGRRPTSTWEIVEGRRPAASLRDGSKV